MSSLSVIVRDNVLFILRDIVRERKQGYLFGDGLIYLMWKTEKGIKGALIPDISYIREENLIRDWKPPANYPGVPDLAIEVVSTNDDAGDLQTKIRRYLERGTEQIWVIYPETQEVLVYRKDQPENVRLVRDEAKIDLGAFFAGVEIAVAEFFRLPMV